MQELGFPCFREEKPLHSIFLIIFNNQFPIEKNSHSFFPSCTTMSSKISMINDSFYASAPTSPNSSFCQNTNSNMCFYSVPNSPTRGILEATCGSGSESGTTMTTTTSNENSNINEFEFETSRRFNIEVEDSDSETHDQKCDVEVEGRKEELPTMAFADELFCEGKVMPLNPPPCQQSSNNNNNIGKYYSTPTSPSNLNSLFRIPFAKRSLWNDDFDPFMVALETVKEGNHRRARSMLPLRACTQFEPEDLMDCKHDNCLHSSPLIFCPNNHMKPNEPAFSMEMKGSKSPIRLSEPKGVLFARRVRMVKMDQKWPNKPTTSPSPSLSQEPIVRTAGETARFNTENKWQKMMRSLGLRPSSMRKTSDEKKQKDQNVEFLRPKILRKLSFMSKKIVHSNEEKMEIQVTKMSLVRYRPKLLLCMGYGAKYA